MFQIVFIGPFSHHSAILPWKETGSEIVWIEQNEQGTVDLTDLEDKLKVIKNHWLQELKIIIQAQLSLIDTLTHVFLQRFSVAGRQMIGCFAAASNLTGILSDTNAITGILHRHGALAFWDYATAGNTK